MLNSITGINEPKILSKYISCECKCRFDRRNVIEINGGITTNVNVSVKNVVYVKKNYVWNAGTCSCENGKYLASIMDDSAIMYDEVIESYNKETNSNEKNQPVKRKISIFYLHFC